MMASKRYVIMAWRNVYDLVFTPVAADNEFEMAMDRGEK